MYGQPWLATGNPSRIYEGEGYGEEWGGGDACMQGGMLVL